MNETLTNLKTAIAALEGQRGLLGAVVVDAALGPMRQQLAALEAAAGGNEQQRRQATVMFADMSGFTAMSATMDAEDMVGIMNSLWERIDKVITGEGGRIISHIGDAVMGVWGTETTREDEPARAVRAALEMQATLARIRAEKGYPIFMRIGLNTGPVLVGDVATTREFTAMGDTVNLASRLEHAAPVGGILISHATYRHVVGQFECVAQPPLTVKGKTEPMQTYVVGAPRKRSFRAPGRGVEGVETRMVGRERELAALQETVEGALTERLLRSATLLAEAGVGKSRMLAEFGRWVESSVLPVCIMQGRAGPETRHTPYALLRDAIGSHFGIEPTDTMAIVRRKLESAIRDADAFLEERPTGGDGAAPEAVADEPALVAAELDERNRRFAMQTDLVAYVLGFDVSASSTVQLHLGDKAALRERGLRHLAGILRALSRRAPLLILLEDAHWADDSSIEAVAKVSWELQRERVAIVCAARPGFVDRFPQWAPGGQRHQTIRLEALSPDDSRRLVAEILKKVDRVPPALRDLVVRQADGNPFYLEELIKMLIEDGIISTATEPWRVQAARLAEVKIPATLTAVLQARLDSLPRDERKVLQRAAVVGRVFWDRAVADIDEPEDPGNAAVDHLPAVRADLERLRRRDMVHGQEGSAFADAYELLFKHALMRDATYESVLLRERRQFHDRVAQWLIAHSGSRRDEIEGVIAGHLEKAGQTEAAAASYHKAGNEAFRRSSFAEALALYDHARDLKPADSNLALDLTVRLGETHLRLGDYNRARPLLESGAATARSRNDLGHEAEAYSYLSTLELNVGNKVAAKDCVARSLALARERNDPEMIAHALIELAWAHFRMGERPEAHACLAESLEHYERLQQPKGLARAHSGLAVIADGHCDFAAARAHREKSLTLYQSIGCRQGVGVVYNDLGEMERLQGNFAAARHHYEEALKVALEIDDGRSAAIALANLGHTHAALADLTQAEHAYREGIATAMAVTAVPWALDSLAGLAAVKARTQGEDEAIRITRMVSAHPALYDDTRPVIQAVLDELRRRVPAAQLESALQSGTMPSLENVIAGLDRKKPPSPPAGS